MLFSVSKAIGVEAKFCTFEPCKIEERAGEMSEWISRAMPNRLAPNRSYTSDVEGEGSRRGLVD